MMQLVLASNNSHKFKELRGILPDWVIRRPADFGISFNHEETGSTFAENAFGKARTLWEQLAAVDGALKDCLVLADDSGLVVPALGGEPGVYSARYGEAPGAPALDDRGRYELLLHRMITVAERQAYFVCNLALITGRDRFITVQETWEGSIATTPMDNGNGFGYDPIFWLSEYNCSVACLPDGEKNRISHRARAMSHLKAYLSTQY